MNCNIWWSLTDAKVRLSEEDLRALHQLRRSRRIIALNEALIFLIKDSQAGHEGTSGVTRSLSPSG
jgi:hypothetical protein